jgi:hypothetical protein
MANPDLVKGFGDDARGDATVGAAGEVFDLKRLRVEYDRTHGRLEVEIAAHGKPVGPSALASLHITPSCTSWPGRRVKHVSVRAPYSDIPEATAVVTVHWYDGAADVHREPVQSEWSQNGKRHTLVFSDAVLRDLDLGCVRYASVHIPGVPGAIDRLDDFALR